MILQCGARTLHTFVKIKENGASVLTVTFRHAFSIFLGH